MKTRADGEILHPIGVVAERTGLSVNVLRAWERRYAVVAPRRGEGGQRLYTDVDVERLRILHRATQGGRSIGQVAPLDTETLRDLVRDDVREEARAPATRETDPVLAAYRSRAMEAVVQLEPELLEGVLMRALVTLGADTFLGEVLGPLLHGVGSGWRSGRLRVAHEHMATPVLRRVLDGMLDLAEREPGAPVLVVATPAGEVHEFGALMAAATAASAGWRVVYLGTDLPAADIALTVRDKRADAVALSVVLADARPRAEAELWELRERLPDLPVLLGGASAAGIEPPPGVTRLDSLEALRRELATLAARPGRGSGGWSGTAAP